MVLTEKDLVPTTPVIKKPKTFNPLGAAFSGLIIGIGHFLINNSFLEKTSHIALGAFGIFLLILAVVSLMAVVSLSTKYALFVAKVEPSKTITNLFALQIVYFYIGYMPIYGFTIVFGSAVREVGETLISSVEFWKIGVTSIIVIVLFTVAIIFNLYIFQKEKRSLGYLKELLFQPDKLYLIIMCTLPVLVSTLVFIFT